MTSAQNGNSSPRRLGAGMIALAWVLLLALVTAYFSGWLERQNNPNQHLVGKIVDDGAREVLLKQNRYGHYVASGRINGQPVRFMLDTGATTVSLPQTLARTLDLAVGAPSAARTANGVITTYQTVLDRVELGNIALPDVRAHINPQMRGDEVLLGMSFLKRIEFTQRGNTLTLRQPPGDR